MAQPGAVWQDLDQSGDGDKGLFVRFSLRPIQDEEKTAESGRPIFNDQEYIEVIVPGDNLNKVHRKVRPDDKQRFRKAYEDFQSKRESPLDGTPLSAWPLVSRSQVEELNFFGVKTVEHLAAMSDSNLQGIGPLTSLRQKARDFVEAANTVDADDDEPGYSWQDES